VACTTGRVDQLSKASTVGLVTGSFFTGFSSILGDLDSGTVRETGSVTE
jgi:hypothetical protein